MKDCRVKKLPIYTDDPLPFSIIYNNHYIDYEGRTLLVYVIISKINHWYAVTVTEYGWLPDSGFILRKDFFKPSVKIDIEYHGALDHS